MMNHGDHGRLGQFSIDQHQPFDNVRRYAKYGELKVAVLGRQTKQIVQGQLGDGRGLYRLDVEMRSIDQQQGKESYDGSAMKGVRMDPLAKSIEYLARKSSRDHEKYVAGLGIQLDNDLSWLKLLQFGRSGYVVDNLVVELASPIQALEFDV
jgi:hypothetical protein